MYILGINGWHTRSHDPSACLVKNGKILAMAEEERFIRQKYAFEKIPINATSYCLHEAKISPSDIDIVAFGWDYKQKYNLRGIKWDYTKNELLDILYPKAIFKYDKKPKLIIVPHHLAHAASVYFTSGYKKAAILIIDGQGEKYSTSIAYGNGRKIKTLKSFPIKDSLGYFYESINKYIGFHYLDSGKTMGLAPYGKPIFTFKNIKLKKDGYSINLPGRLRYSKKHLDEQESLVSLWHKFIKQKYIKKPNPTVNKFNKLRNKIKVEFKISESYKNLAASAQKALEETVGHLAKVSIKMTNCNNLCISGGVGLNCVVNGKLLHNKSIKNLYIFPAANDAGVSVGAALYASAILDKNLNFSRLNHAYFGPEYTDQEVKSAFKERKINYKFYPNICKKTAELLSRGKIVGWVHGRMEMGPRALGNRSILANPKTKSMWKKINLIKNRELWRPLSPSILNEYKDNYFESAQYSPFMLKTFGVKKKNGGLISAVVHVDDSTRPQTVSKKINPKFWHLINEFYKITGIPSLFNTSFNLINEPIVCSPQDALSTFYNSGLDCLVINNFLVTK
ncbi:MAG: carbamoyltransferase C-terminal domain-containing protein [Patescibacteria group bacterium]